MKKQFLMLHSKVLFFALLSFFLLSGCSNKNNDGNNKENSSSDEEQVDLTTPFAYVPEAVDVVMYEVNLRAFAPQSSLKAVTKRLDEIKTLGVNVIWLMPIYEQGELKGKGSPYSIKNYKALNPEYGTMDDLRQLVGKAHAKDMAVIMDLVADHTSWDNPWITEHSNWYKKNALGEIVFPDVWEDVAALNWDNTDEVAAQELQDAMIDAMKFWFTEANIDGYRCDAVDVMPDSSIEFWREAINQLRELNKGRRILMLAEGNKKDYFSAGFDMSYGWNYYERLKSLYTDENQTFAFFFRAHKNEIEKIPANNRQIYFTTNHDESAWDKTPVELFHGERGAISAFALTATFAGTPLIYSTQEIGRKEIVPFFNYTAIDWSQNPEIFEEYKQLMSVYNSTTLFKKGMVESFPEVKDVVCFTKSNDAEKALVAVNVRNRAVTFTVPEEFVGTEWTNAMNNENITLTSTMEMTPYQYYILKQ